MVEGVEERPLPVGWLVIVEAGLCSLEEMVMTSGGLLAAARATEVGSRSFERLESVAGAVVPASPEVLARCSSTRSAKGQGAGCAEAAWTSALAILAAVTSRTRLLAAAIGWTVALAASSPARAWLLLLLALEVEGC